MRTIGVVTVARSDYGLYLPVLRQIQAQSDLQLHLIVSGMHLSPEFGLTVGAIEADGFTVSERVEMLLSSDAPVGTAKSIGLGVIGFAQSFARVRPDLLLLLGDRFEMFAAGLAALPFGIPVAHIHGGEVTHGAIDDALRHSLTKLSHLHFVATAEYAQRVRQLGEEPWRITITGAPGLDNLRQLRLLTCDELQARYNLHLPVPFLLVTFHPVTLEYEYTNWHTTELLAALDEINLPVVFTMPNADTGGRLIQQMIAAYASQHPSAAVVDNLGTLGYFSMMDAAAAMVGNSSSGLIEAPSFGLPVVNIGTRQSGRVRTPNVIDVDYPCAEIVTGLRQALEPGLRQYLRTLPNPYGDGHASERIVERLRTVSLDAQLTMKRFVDLDMTVLIGVLP